MSIYSMLRAPRPGAVALLIACWAAANGLAYLVICRYDAVSWPGKRRVSFAARQRYARGVSVTRQQERETRQSVCYRLLHPINEAPGVRYPLLVFLHGSGERGSDNESQLIGLPEQMVEDSWQRRFPCYLLAPQCPLRSKWRDFSDELIDVIRDMLQKHPIDRGRVYLTGLSMGGFGCWSLAEKDPQLFTAVVPVCGGGSLIHADRLVNTPIWAVHGDADRVVPVLRSREMIEAIREVGGRPKYTELKNVGHDSWTQTYRNPDGVLKWMFSQRRLIADERRQ